MLPLVMLADEELYPITLGLDNWRAQTIGSRSSTSSPPAARCCR
jgi:hypothetical protein